MSDIENKGRNLRSIVDLALGLGAILPINVRREEWTGGLYFCIIETNFELDTGKLKYKGYYSYERDKNEKTILSFETDESDKDWFMVRTNIKSPWEVCRKEMFHGDPINHPAHYNQGKIEVIEFLEDQNLDFHLANTLKYICRAGKKDADKELQDLEKAAWYLARRIELVKAKTEGRDPIRPNAMKK